MTRSRATAKKAGTAWESAIVACLIAHGWPHAERRPPYVLGIPGVSIEAVDLTSDGGDE